MDATGEDSASEPFPGPEPERPLPPIAPLVLRDLALKAFAGLRQFFRVVLVTGRWLIRFTVAEPQSTIGLRRRASWVVTAIGLLWLVLAGRLVQLQFIQRDELLERAQRQREVVEEIAPRPGDIFDRQGRMLATSVTAHSLYLVPSRLTKPWTIAAQLGPALNVSPEELFVRFGRNTDRHFLWVKRRLSEEEFEAVRALELPPELHGFRPEYRRVYPQGSLAAQVLGLRDIDGKGQGGVEQACEATLGGEPGQRTLTRDARGRIIDIERDDERAPRDGQDVQLTIDSVLQHYAERELAKLMDEYHPESCCALVMDPRMGELLAMASAPTLDPNHPELADPDAWKNRAIADIYEPGSTFKPMIVAYGVDRQKLAIEESFYCERGVYRMGRRVLHDHHGYGTLNLTDVLVKSSNIGMAKVGERLTNDGLHAAATAFGFGRPTGIELPGELGGILRPREQWTSYSTGSIPMGHEIATTPLQLLRAHAVLANGGQLVTPHILQTSVYATESVPRVIRQESAEWVVREPMRQTVLRGTGKKAQIAGYSVFGKTGTAQSLSPQGGYRHGKYIASFVCGAPTEHPEVLVLVVVNQATTGGEAFGGRVAAPAAAEILKHALTLRNVAPDVTAETPQRGVHR